MDEQLCLEQLKICELFKGLSARELKALYNSMNPVAMKSGEVLVKQGDPSDSLYVLLNGRLVAQTNNGKTVGQIGRGQTVGEMGLISQMPRSATVTAIRDSFLLKLDQEHFKKLWEAHPDVLFAVSKIITARLQQTLRAGQGVRHLNFVVMRANDHVNSQEFFEKLQASFDARFRYKIVKYSDFDPHLSREQLCGLFQVLENSYDYIFYDVDYHHNVAWRDACLDVADRLMIVAPGHVPAACDLELVRLLNDSHRVHPEIKKILVLIYPQNVQSHYATSWLETFKFFRYYHVGLADGSDMERLLRYINGTAVGLVLGGGGSRAWAQAGVMKYFFEEQVPIDAFAGTSAGSINAAILSIARDFQDYLEISHEIQRKTNFKEYTIPLLSLLSSRSITTVLKLVFGNRRIEDLPRYFSCVAADLTSATEVTIDSGPLWQAIRSSISIPGVYPPVHHNGMVLVDGGVVNNLPSDVLRHYFEGQGKIIAIDIGSVSSSACLYNYPLELTWTKIILLKFFSRLQKLSMPTIGDTFLRGLLIASGLRDKENIKNTDLYIKPNLSGFGLLDSSRVDEMLALGYATAQEVCVRWAEILEHQKTKG